jgi:hypothetical protein
LLPATTDRPSVPEGRGLGRQLSGARLPALVDAYVRLGQSDLALQVIRSGLTALPDSPELLDRLARLERKQE